MRFPIHAVAGLVAGVFAVALMQLPGKWVVSGIAGLMLLVFALAQKDMPRYVSVLLVLAIPLATFNRQLFARRDYFGTPGIAVGVVEAALIGLAIARLTMPERVPVRAMLRTGVGACAIALVAAAAISLPFAEDRTLAAFGLVDAAKGVLLFALVGATVTDRKGLRWVVDALLAAVLVQEILALTQWATGSSLGLSSLGESSQLMRMTFGGDTFVRVAATLVHPNQFANFLGLVLPLALALALAGGRGPVARAFYGGVFVLGLLIFILTFSRTGWFHIGTSTLVVCAILLAKGRLGVQSRNLGIIAGLLATILVVSFSPAIAARLFESNPVLVTGRFDMARVALDMFVSRPLAGVGINNYMEALPLFDHKGVMPAPVHNVYLLVAAEMGVVGLAAFGAVIVALIRTLMRAVAGLDRAVSTIAIGMLGGLAGFLVDGISDFSYILPSTHLLFWLLAGLTVALPGIGAQAGGEACADSGVVSLPGR